MATIIPTFAKTAGTSTGSSIGLKVQPSSADDGTYVAVVALDTESEISVGAVSQEGSWTVTADAGANLNTSALALETGGNLATLAGTVSAGKVKVDPSGVTSPVSLASLPALAAGSAEIGFVGPSGSNGIDYSANAPSVSGLSLLATIPANTARLGYFIQNQSTSVLTVVMDDQAGSLTPTIVVLGAASSNGTQGSAIDMDGLPHSGRIRVYSTSAGVQMAARAW